MTSTASTDTTQTIYTPREAILHSAQFLKKTISVQGTVVLADAELGRVDISHQGAKLIVRVNSSTSSMPQLQQQVVVTGVLRKEQRRTFLLADSVECCSTGA